jgi:hypothetical protein
MAVSAIDLDLLFLLAVDVTVAVQLQGSMTVHALETALIVEIRKQVVVELPVDLRLPLTGGGPRRSVWVCLHEARERDPNAVSSIVTDLTLLGRYATRDLVPHGMSRLALGYGWVSTVAQPIGCIEHVAGRAATAAVVPVAAPALRPQVAAEAFLPQVVVHMLSRLPEARDLLQSREGPLLGGHIAVLVRHRTHPIDGLLGVLSRPQVASAANDAGVGGVQRFRRPLDIARMTETTGLFGHAEIAGVRNEPLVSFVRV